VTAHDQGRLEAQVKLVIWDLDETFWTGTLSEGEVTLVDEHADIIRALNRRGIVSAICSKNDAATVEARLRMEGDLWDEFVFPRVGWTPKGQTIAQLIDDMQLRPPNVLFIDDNVGNLQEARHYSPELQIAGPEIISQLLDLPQLRGKDDRALSRLAQYRQLQAKVADRWSADVSNEEFLRDCDVRVEIERDCDAEASRLLELVNRTNQLNYTKSRLTEAELDGLVADAAVDVGLVRVVDRYGDYGICGFFAVQGDVVRHFAFSCRILHMGVENWVYQHLGCPRLEVVGDVATPIEPSRAIDWVNAGDGAHERPVQPRGVRSKVLLKGGCDLVQVNDFLAGSLKTELSYTNELGAYVEWHHSEVIRRSTPETLERFGEVIDRLPFISRTEYRTEALDPHADVSHVALSLLNEYGQGLYRLKGADFVVPFGQYYVDATDSSNWGAIETELGHAGMTRAFLEWFAEAFAFEGAVPVERFEDNLRWLTAALPGDRTLVLINGAEIDLGGDDEATGRLHEHQRRYNDALDRLLIDLTDVRLCDVREFVVGRDDVTFNTRHYTRKTYMALADALRDQSEAGLRVVERRNVVLLAHRVARLLRQPQVLGRIRRMIRMSLRRLRTS
jgi:FkbH-like protein